MQRLANDFAVEWKGKKIYAENGIYTEVENEIKKRRTEGREV